MSFSLESFYKENEDFLKENYPGIKLMRLIQEIEECSHLSLDEFKNKLLQGIPLEYISNTAHFYRSSFYVDKRVLIPRSETEILVEDSINYIKENNLNTVFEIGTGSGCIAISIAMECDLEISASDISKDAIEVAQKNAKNHECEIKFECIDLIGQGKYDLIVSNPPYIKKDKDKDGVHYQTHKFEPHIALYLEDEKFENWFEQLFYKVSNSLSSKGAFFMEGHEDSLKELKKIAQKYFKKNIIKKDYTHRDRFLHCFKEENG